jgi:uridine kinase
MSSLKQEWMRCREQYTAKANRRGKKIDPTQQYEAIVIHREGDEEVAISVKQAKLEFKAKKGIEEMCQVPSI